MKVAAMVEVAKVAAMVEAAKVAAMVEAAKVAAMVEVAMVVAMAEVAMVVTTAQEAQVTTVAKRLRGMSTERSEQSDPMFDPRPPCTCCYDCSQTHSESSGSTVDWRSRNTWTAQCARSST